MKQQKGQQLKIRFFNDADHEKLKEIAERQDRSLTYRTPMETLIRLRNQYRAEVGREQAKASGKSLFGRVVRVKLG